MAKIVIHLQTHKPRRVFFKPDGTRNIVSAIRPYIFVFSVFMHLPPHSLVSRWNLHYHWTRI